MMGYKVDVMEYLDDFFTWDTKKIKKELVKKVQLPSSVEIEDITHATHGETCIDWFLRKLSEENVSYKDDHSAFTIEGLTSKEIAELIYDYTRERIEVFEDLFNYYG